MEHISGVPLSDHIRKNKHLKENNIKLYTKQTVDAIDYMHSKFVMHRDIKSSNIMLVSKTWIKLIDFGMAKHLEIKCHEVSSASSMVGTLSHMAPEVRNFECYNSKADIFSIGALIYEMANGDPYVRVSDDYITETL
jgi:serine/threonine protein kinase